MYVKYNMNITIRYAGRNLVHVMTLIRARLIRGKTEKLEVDTELFPSVVVGWHIYKTNFMT